MTCPILALRAAILAHAAADQDLVTRMGGSLRLFDEPPRGAEPVYAVFGDVTAEDWSTDLDRGHEQSLQLVIWSREGSARSGLLVAERLAMLLDGASLSLTGHRLVNLRVSAVAAARDEETGLARVILRLRAVTEVASAAEGISSGG